MSEIIKKTDEMANLTIDLDDDVIQLLIELQFNGYSDESMSLFYEKYEENIEQAVYDAVLNEGVITTLKAQIEHAEEEKSNVL